MPIQYRSEALLHALANLHRQAPDVRGTALMMTNEGIVIAAYPPGWDRNIHDPTGGESVAAMASVVIGTAERTMARLELGQLERVLLEGENYIIGIFPVTGDASLAVLIDKEAKLGLTFHIVGKATETIAEILNTTR